MFLEFEEHDLVKPLTLIGERFYVARVNNLSRPWPSSCHRDDSESDAGPGPPLPCRVAVTEVVHVCLSL